MNDRSRPASALALHVLATTPDGTQSALELAARLIDDTDAQLVVLVPRYPSARPGASDESDVDVYRALAARLGVQATVIGCVCRRLDDIVRQMLGRSSLIIVGGARRLWWPSREQRLADRLMTAGYPVLFSCRHTTSGTRTLAASALWPAIILTLLSVTGPVHAQENSSTPAPAAARADTAGATASPLADVLFGATLETFYEYDGNRPPDRVLPLRAYDTRANTFGIQQAAIVLELPADVADGRRFGARLDLQFGMATDTVQGSPANEPRPAAYRNLWQAYGTYIFPLRPRGLQVDVGKYASTLGYETNYAKDDQTFSRALLFDFLPFYNTGVRVTFPVNAHLSLVYMLSNGIQETEDFNNFKSSQFAAVLKPTGAITWVLNGYIGQEQRDNGRPGEPDGFFKVFDTYATIVPRPNLTLAIDVNHTSNQVIEGGARTSLDGAAAYVRYQAAHATAAGLRYEHLADSGLFTGVRQTVQEATATLERRLSDGFLVRAELRRDWSSSAFFPGPLGAADPRPFENTALVGCIWWFGNKQGVW
ncbi:MAG TPA: outer membrane beta-barrel protein [Vicinamibacterales bacterium]